VDQDDQPSPTEQVVATTEPSSTVRTAREILKDPQSWFLAGYFIAQGNLLSALKAPSWLWVAAAVICLPSCLGWRWIAARSRRKKVFWSIFLPVAAVLLVLAVVPSIWPPGSSLTIVNVPAPEKASDIRSIRATHWGNAGTTSAFVTVDARQLLTEKDVRLFVIAKIVDDAVDSYADTRIDKSALFTIDTASKRMEVVLGKPTMNRLAGAGGALQLFVCIVPEKLDVDRVKSIGDVFKQKGALGANPSFLVPPRGAGRRGESPR